MCSVARSGGNVKSYRKEKRAANNRSAVGDKTTTAAPTFAHARALEGNWQHSPAQVLAQLRFFNQTDQEHQHHSSDCRSDQAPDQSAGVDAKGTEDPTSYEGADNAEDQIPNQAVAAAFHQLSGKPASHQADEEKPQEMHIILPPCEPAHQIRRRELARTIMAQMGDGCNRVCCGFRHRWRTFGACAFGRRRVGVWANGGCGGTQAGKRGQKQEARHRENRGRARKGGWCDATWAGDNSAHLPRA